MYQERDYMNCQCDWCKWYAEYKVIIETVPPETKAFFENMANHIVSVEEDLSYYKAIVENTWPDAHRILGRYHNLAPI